MRKAPVMTWAEFPGPSAAPQGLYFFSNIGVNGSFWYNDGTKLSPIAPILLYRLLTAFTSTTGTAEETYAVTGKIPIGVLAIGRQLRAELLLTKSGTAESTSSNVKIGTNADGKTGATSISSAFSTLTGSNRQLAFVQTQTFLTNTSVQQSIIGGSAVPYGVTTSSTGITPRTIPDISANELYVSLTGTKTTGGIETVTVPAFDVWLQ